MKAAGIVRIRDGDPQKTRGDTCPRICAVPTRSFFPKPALLCPTLPIDLICFIVYTISAIVCQKNTEGSKYLKPEALKSCCIQSKTTRGRLDAMSEALHIIQDPPLTYHQEPLVLARLGENTDDSLRDSDAAYAGRFAALARALGAEKAYVV